MGPITYISFIITDQDLHLGLLESPLSSLFWLCAFKVLTLSSTYYFSCVTSICVQPCHMIYAQWTYHSSHALLCHLWLCLPTWICFLISIPRRLDSTSPSRSSVAHTYRGPHATPSRLSQAMSVVDVTSLHGSQEIQRYQGSCPFPILSGRIQGEGH